MKITVNQLLDAALELQYYIEIQPVGKVRLLDGSSDVRNGERFKQIVDVLKFARLSLDYFDGAVCPKQMLFIAMSVGNFNSECGSEVTPQFSNFAKKVRELVTEDEFKIIDSVGNRLKSNFPLRLVATGESILE